MVQNSDTKECLIKEDLPTTPKERLAWCFYNVAYEGIIASVLLVFLPVHLASLGQRIGYPLDNPPTEDSKYYLSIFGSHFSISSIIFLANAIGIFLQAVVFISCGALADYGASRKKLLMGFTLMGSMFTLLLAFTAFENMFWLGVALDVLLHIVSGVCLLFYNAYLPILTRNHPSLIEMREHVSTGDGEYILKSGKLGSSLSAKSLIFGYLAAVFQLVMSAVLIVLTGRAFWSMPVSMSFSGMWWLVFSLVSFKYLKTRPGEPLPSETNFFFFSWKSVGKTLSKLNQIPSTFYFILAFFLYGDAYSTMAYVAIVFAKQELKMTEEKLIASAIIIPFMAFVGNFTFYFIQRKLKLSVKSMLIITVICMALLPLYGLFSLTNLPFGLKHDLEIFIFAGYFGLIMGALQSYSRTLYSEIIPKGCESEFFSLYAITDKGSFVGQLLVVFVEKIFGKIAFSFVVLALLLICSLPILVWKVDVAKAKEDCRRFVISKEQ